ncbi:ependymin-like [Kryptolebias marmoratus]|uniref:Ependymin-like n=1 Tax=Kryptolebias marmoratus TaxID=37003 RepID=A0A3Q3EV61_KRYMA|nr:ependymin-like [Kryptolebias marmoratus]
MLQRKVNLTSDDMRALSLLVCLSVGCLAQKPQPCSSPSLMSGGLSVSTQSDRLVALAKYTYDAVGQRIRLRELGTYDNKTFFHLDILLLYRQGIMYKIDSKDSTCVKKPLTEDFHPLAVPKDASLVGQFVLGSSSVPGEGILVNTWAGELQMRRGTAEYLSTVTEFGCLPVSTMFCTDKKGWVMVSFFNNIAGLADPQDFTPPPFCNGARPEEEEEENLAAFFSLF